MNPIYMPSQERYNVSASAYNGSTLTNCNWEVRVRAAREIVIPKSSAIYVDENSYDFIVDTARIGPGVVTLELRWYIKDSAAPDGTRTLVKRFVTNDFVVE